MLKGHVLGERRWPRGEPSGSGAWVMSAKLAHTLTLLRGVLGGSG